jgi:hypothetical protein
MNLPEFPYPDLPSSHPMNYPTLKVRMMRRLGFPDDGRMWINDAIGTEPLESYNGTIVNETTYTMDIAFPTMSDGMAWADMITATGHDREMVGFATAPASVYGAVTIRISF